MNTASTLKGLGYLTSTLSVILLGIVAIDAASKSTLLASCLIGGMTTSIIGMTLRWRSHRIEQHEKSAIKKQVTNAWKLDS